MHKHIVRNNVNVMRFINGHFFKTLHTVSTTAVHLGKLWIGIDYILLYIIEVKTRVVQKWQQIVRCFA